MSLALVCSWPLESPPSRWYAAKLLLCHLLLLAIQWTQLQRILRLQNHIYGTISPLTRLSQAGLHSQMSVTWVPTELHLQNSSHRGVLALEPCLPMTSCTRQWC